MKPISEPQCGCSMCRNLSHRELLNLCRTDSATATATVTATAHILRRCAGAGRGRARHACASGILMCKVQQQSNIKSRARPLFVQHRETGRLGDWKTERLKDSFARFIILYNSPYAVLFITTHAMALRSRRAPKSIEKL